MAETVIAPDLLPCPFCGSTAFVGKGTKKVWVQCRKCDAITAPFSRYSKARQAWNKRTAEQENVALRAKLQQISDWCEAYPLDVFTEPDMVEVRKLLGDTLLTQLSAHNFRHVIDGIKQIAARGRQGESEVQP